MPILQQEAIAKTEDQSVLNDLLTIPPQSQPSTTKPRRRKANTYETIISKIALAVALSIAIGIWWTGARFTLEWLRSIGIPIAQLGIFAWLLPISITALEIGMIAARSRVIWAWVFWIAILGFDIYTTAAGMLSAFENQHILGYTLTNSDPTSWAIVGIAGILIAVSPEPAARGIWHELWS